MAELRDEWLSSFVNAVNSLLTEHATDDIIAHAIKIFESYKQTSRVIVALYTKCLNIRALCCRIVYEENIVKMLFVEKFIKSDCNKMRVYLKQHSRALFTKLNSDTDTLFKTTDRSVRVDESSKDMPLLPAPKSNRSYAYAAMTSDRDG